MPRPRLYCNVERRAGKSTVRPCSTTTRPGSGLVMMLLFLMMLVMLGPVRADAQHPTYLGRTLYTGEFHAHTSVSDGAKLPADAFAHVYQHSGVDFFTL